LFISLFFHQPDRHLGRFRLSVLRPADKLNVFIRSHFPGINQDCGFGRFAAALDGDFIIFNFIKRCRRASGLRRPCGRLDEDNPVFTCFISRNDFYLQFRFLCILLIREILRFLFL
jgi:hypothetical protein